MSQPSSLTKPAAPQRGQRRTARLRRGHRGGRALRIGFAARPAAHEPDVDQMALDHLADRGQQRGHVAPAHPLAAARIEHRLQLLDHEGDIAAAPEHGADHARQRHRPGVMLHVLRVDEDLERPPAPVLLDVVDGDVEGVVEIGPAHLVGVAGQLAGTVERLGHVDDVAAFGALGRPRRERQRRARGTPAVMPAATPQSARGEERSRADADCRRQARWLPAPRRSPRSGR